MPGLDMLVRFGYCIICDNGPDKKNREWVTDLVQDNKIPPVIKQCSSCKGGRPNKNLLYLAVDIPGMVK